MIYLFFHMQCVNNVSFYYMKNVWYLCFQTGQSFWRFNFLLLEHGLARMWVSKYLLPCFIWFVCLCSNPFWYSKANLTVVIISISLLSLQILLLHYKSWLLLSWLFTCSLPGTDCCCCLIVPHLFGVWCQIHLFFKGALSSCDISKSSAFETTSSLTVDTIRSPKELK